MKKSLIIAFFLLSGCMLNQEKRMAVFEDTCAKYGYEKGTDKFADCMRDENKAWIDKINYGQMLIGSSNSTDAYMAVNHPESYYQQRQVNLLEDIKRNQNSGFKPSFNCHAFGDYLHCN